MAHQWRDGQIFVRWDGHCKKPQTCCESQAGSDRHSGSSMQSIVWASPGASPVRAAVRKGNQTPQASGGPGLAIARIREANRGVPGLIEAHVRSVKFPKPSRWVCVCWGCRKNRNRPIIQESNPSCPCAADAVHPGTRTGSLAIFQARPMMEAVAISSSSRAIDTLPEAA